MENNIEYYKLECGCLLSFDKEISTAKSLLQCNSHTQDKDKSFTLKQSLGMSVVVPAEEITKAEASIMFLEGSSG